MDRIDPDDGQGPRYTCEGEWKANMAETGIATVTGVWTAGVGPRTLPRRVMGELCILPGSFRKAIRPVGGVWRAHTHLLLWSRANGMML